MIKNKLLVSILILTMLLVAYSGTGAVQPALAQPQNPPTVSSPYKTPAEKPASSLPAITDEAGPATDDYIAQEGAVTPLALPATPDPDHLINSDSWFGSTPHGLSGNSLNGGSQNFILYDNGPLITHPGGGFSGSDVSALQTSLGLTTYGFGSNQSDGWRVADDFTISSATGWWISDITFYTYMTGTYSYPPASTITGLYLQIWNGSPDNPSSTIVFGDQVTNRMIGTYWTNIYRTTDTNLSDTSRPIMAVVADVSISLPAGTYWLDWSVTGTGISKPWSPPISILGQSTTGNAIHHLSSWNPALDTGNTFQQGFPFVIEGEVEKWLWHQPVSTDDSSPYISQRFPDLPTYDSFITDDFIADQTWAIDTIYVPGVGWNGFTSLMNATTLNWKIYADNGGVPAGDPTGGGAPAVWSLSLSPNDPNVTISLGVEGDPSDTLLKLPTPIKLPAGHYWLFFYPTMPFNPYGQFGRRLSDTTSGYSGLFINPGGGFGYGTTWQSWSVIGASLHDSAFSIGGTKNGNWKSIAPINSDGRSRPAAATVGGKIYLFGGETQMGRANTVERYDPATNTWTTRSGTMPIPASNICAAVIGTDVYIPGGYDASSNYLNALQVYHTTSDTWNIITTDPLPASLMGAGCASLNNKLYVFGGNNLGTYQSAAYVYNPALTAGSRWTAIASMSNPRAYLSGTAVNGKIYAIGGLNGTDVNDVEAFNPADGLWHSVTDLHIARAGLGAYSVGNTLYACGGGWNSYLDSCETYDTTQGYSGTWKYLPAYMLEGRRTFGAASIGPVLYAVAGWRGIYLKTAEKWSFDAYLPLTLR